MKVTVDQGLCYGSRDCVHRVGAVFTTVDGFGAVVPGREDSGDDPRVREAAEQCPAQAISITEGR